MELAKTLHHTVDKLRRVMASPELPEALCHLMDVEVAKVEGVADLLDLPILESFYPIVEADSFRDMLTGLNALPNGPPGTDASMPRVLYFVNWTCTLPHNKYIVERRRVLEVEKNPVKRLIEMTLEEMAKTGVEDRRQNLASYLATLAIRLATVEEQEALLLKFQNKCEDIMVCKTVCILDGLPRDMVEKLVMTHREVWCKTITFTEREMQEMANMYPREMVRAQWRVAHASLVQGSV